MRSSATGGLWSLGCIVLASVWTIQTARGSTDVNLTSSFVSQQDASLLHHSSACDAWLPDLMKIKAWRSSGTRCQQDITVTTQLSMDRLDMLERLCQTWHGWVSAAVYLHTHPDSHSSHLHIAVRKLDDLHLLFEQNGKCHLDMMLYTPQGPPPPHHHFMHPLNALRNKAIAAAQTEVLLLLDVDFMISSNLNDLQHSSWLYSVVSQGVLVILPAFEPVSDDSASQAAVIRACQGGKAEALAGVGQELLQPFHVKRFAAGHSATDFPRWLASDELYNIQYSMGFEPYVIVSKSLVPWYDERFTGYLEDKVVHIQTMHHMGFQFAVHPAAFVTHYPHPDSTDQALVKSTRLIDEIQGMGDGARAEMAAGVYLPPTRFAPCHAPYKFPATTGFVHGCSTSKLDQSGPHVSTQKLRAVK